MKPQLTQTFSAATEIVAIQNSRPGLADTCSTFIALERLFNKLADREADLWKHLTEEERRRLLEII